MAALTAQALAHLGVALVIVDWDDVVPVTGAGVSVSVLRHYPDGTTDELLGSPTELSQGVAVFYDTLLPLDVPIYYTAVTGLSSPQVTGGLRSNTIIVTGQGDGWLRDPLEPVNDVHLGDCLVDCPAAALDLGVPTTLLYDTYTRTASNGFGTADTGQVTTTSGGSASDYSVNGTTGLVSLGSVNVARLVLYPLTDADVDVRVRFASPVLALTSAINAYVGARWTDTSNNYMARLAFNPYTSVAVSIERRVAGVINTIGTATNQPGVLHVAGAYYWLRFQVVGTTLRVKAWRDGTVEPADWTVVVDDSAHATSTSVVLRLVLSSGNTNSLPVVMSVDDLSVTVPSFDVGPGIEYSAVLRSFETDTLASATGLFPIVQAARGRSVAGTRKDRVGQLNLTTRRLAQDLSVEVILASGRTLFLQLDDAYGWAYRRWAADFIEVGDAIDARLSETDMRQTERLWSLPVSLARKPGTTSGHVGGNGLGVRGATYGDGYRSGRTYQTRTANTYLQSSQGIGL